MSTTSVPRPDPAAAPDLPAGSAGGPRPSGSRAMLTGSGAAETRLPWWHLLVTAAASLVLAAILLVLIDAFSIASAVILGFFLHLVIGCTYSRIREGRRCSCGCSRTAGQSPVRRRRSTR